MTLEHILIIIGLFGLIDILIILGLFGLIVVLSDGRS